MGLSGKTLRYVQEKKNMPIDVLKSNELRRKNRVTRRQRNSNLEKGNKRNSILRGKTVN